MCGEGGRTAAVWDEARWSLGWCGLRARTKRVGTVGWCVGCLDRVQRVAQRARLFARPRCGGVDCLPVGELDAAQYEA